MRRESDRALGKFRFIFNGQVYFCIEGQILPAFDNEEEWIEVDVARDKEPAPVDNTSSSWIPPWIRY